MKILVAEDDPQSSEFLRKGLVQEGHSVECVGDGRDALSYCLYNNCDMLILDRMMPGMDGLTVLKTLRAAGRKVPVLFLTSMGDVEDRVEGLLAGGDDYLVKPFHFSELLARVTSLARRPAGNEQQTRLIVHDLELDLLSHTAKRAGINIDLLSGTFQGGIFLISGANDDAVQVNGTRLGESLTLDSAGRQFASGTSLRCWP